MDEPGKGPGNGESAGWVTIAVLGKVRGNAGEVTATSLSDRTGRFERLGQVFLFGEGKPYQVESVWFHDGRPIFKFAGVDSISAAENLAGMEVRVPAAERAPLEAGEFFQSDLVGCRVLDRSTEEELGTVEAWQDWGGNGMLMVKRPGESEPLMVPFAKAICVEIDCAARRIVVAMPEGLKELNRS